MSIHAIRSHNVSKRRFLKSRKKIKFVKLKLRKKPYSIKRKLKHQNVYSIGNPYKKNTSQSKNKNVFLSNYNERLRELKNILIDYLEETNNLFLGPEYVPLFIKYVNSKNDENAKMLLNAFIRFIEEILENRGVAKDDEYYFNLFAYEFLKPEIF